MRRFLTLPDRQIIESMKAAGELTKNIAIAIGFSSPCVTKELQRNPTPYNAANAHAAAYDINAARKRKPDPKLQRKYRAPTKPKCASCHGAKTKTIYRNHQDAIVLECPVCG